MLPPRKKSYRPSLSGYPVIIFGKQKKSYRLSGYRAIQRLYSGTFSNSHEKRETQCEKKKFQKNFPAIRVPEHNPSLIIFIIGAADIMNSSRLLVRDGGIDHHVAVDGMSRTVPGQAVAPSTRVNKSRCDRKCRFPSVGGLHRSSHD